MPPQVRGDGVNFCVFSAHATLVELCLFDSQGLHEVGRAPLPAPPRLPSKNSPGQIAPW